MSTLSEDISLGLKYHPVTALTVRKMTTRHQNRMRIKRITMMMIRIKKTATHPRQTRMAHMTLLNMMPVDGLNPRPRGRMHQVGPRKQRLPHPLLRAQKS